MRLEFQDSGAPSEHRNTNDEVIYELDLEGVELRWGVRSLTLREGVSEPFVGILEAIAEGPAVEIALLLGCPFSLRLRHGSDQRWLRGIIRQASVSGSDTYSQYRLHLVPSLWRLGQGLDSRIYQNINIPDLVVQVVRLLGPGVVDVDISLLTRVYETHESIVQYQESFLNFISRWMEDEGLFFFLVATDQGEKMILADSATNLPLARPGAGGHVVHQGPLALDASPKVSHLHHAEELGATRMTISDYDWTNPALDVAGTREMPSPLIPPIEIYDHTDVVTYHRYSGAQYLHNTADQRVQDRSTALEILRQRWSMRSHLVSAQPGHVLHVDGAPDAALNGSYMIVRCESGGLSNENVHGTWSSSLILMPTSITYRPAPRTPRPVVSGPETAVVVAPSGDDIHTDRHGRIKVRFHWDRQHLPKDENSSCWIRVQQGWAGLGFGLFFLPRVGMEVVVSFLGGNPDRPLVTGCVYNGTNRAPVELPAQETQSCIRTHSASTNNQGYNEIRFEDLGGQEEISIHAQRDLSETIRRNHTTHVDGAQSISVGGDQRVNVSAEQIVHADKMTFKAASSIQLICGQSSITLKPREIVLAVGRTELALDKNATLLATKVAIEGRVGAALRGGDGAGSVVVDAVGVDVRGPLIKLNS